MADISIHVEELDYPSDFVDDAALADELSLCRDQTKDVWPKGMPLLQGA